MERACASNGEVRVSEILIVDTFTKLIFGEADQYSDDELAIIQALRQVDPNVALNSHSEMGKYLRVLGVREMTGLVGQVRSFMSGADMVLPTASTGFAAGHSQQLH